MNQGAILCAGNWLVDLVNFIDKWPARGELVQIRRQTRGVGGAGANVATSLRRLQAPVAVGAAGCVGHDELGNYLLEHCRSEGILTEGLLQIPDEVTSHTYVMTLSSTGERTFFHRPGANDKFSPDHVDLAWFWDHGFRHVHLGYLLLLGSFDSLYEDGTTAASRWLQRAQALGFSTSVDIVSEASDRFERIVTPALRHADYVIINELEAAAITGLELRRANGTLEIDEVKRATSRLVRLGARSAAVVHAPEGAAWVDAKSGDCIWQPTEQLSPEQIVSSVGAGDAFCAATLMGLQLGASPHETLRAAHRTATACLQLETATGPLPHWGS